MKESKTEAPASRRSSGELKKLVGQQRWLVVAFVLFSLFTFFMFQDVALIAPDSVDARLLDSAYQTACVCAIVASLLIALSLRHRKETLPAWWVLITSAVIGIVGVLAVFFSGYLGVLSEAATILGAALMGAASVAWLPGLMWGFASVGPRATLACVGIGYLAESLLVLILSALPAIASVVIAVVVAAAMPFALKAELTECASTAPRRDQSWDAGTPSLIKLDITYLVLGLTSGIVASFAAFSDSSIAGALQSFVSFALAGALIAAIAIAARADFDHLLFVVGLPLLALGFLATVMLAPESPAANVPQQTADAFVEMLTWALTAYLVRYEKVPCAWAALFPSCFLYLGHAVGTACGSTAFALDTSTPALTLFVSLVVFVIMLAAVAMLGAGDKSGWRSARPADVEPQNATDAACRRVADQFGLTAREAEILGYLARGRTKAHIAEDLGISQDTAKTHITRVYRKTGVHSQQQLLDLLDKTSEDLSNQLM